MVTFVVSKWFYHRCTGFVWFEPGVNLVGKFAMNFQEKVQLIRSKLE